MALSDASRALREVGSSPGMRRVLLAFLFFNIAEWATWVAMLVFAYQRGGATTAGVVAVVQLLPGIFVAPIGAVIGDRIPRNRALALAYGGMAVALVAAGVVLAVHAPAPIAYLMGAVANAALTLIRPVHNSILPELAERPETLTAANALSSTIEGLSTFVGPVVTGVLLTTNGAGAVFLVMGAFLVVSSALAIGVALRPSIRALVQGQIGSVVAEATAGFRELRQTPGAGAIMSLFCAQFVVMGLMDVLAVVLALEVFSMSPSGPGLLTGALGLGALLGSAATITLIGRKRLSTAIGVGALVTGVPLAFMTVVPAPAQAVILLMASGMGRAFVDVGGRTLLQRAVRDEVLSRVFGLQESVAMLGLTIGSAVAPLLVVWLGGRGAFLAAGAFLPAMAIFTWRQLSVADRLAAPPDPARLALLRSISIFHPLAQPVIERLSRNLVPVRVAEHEVVIRQGDPGDRFYLVEDGGVTVSVDGRRIADLGPGDFFGEIALLRDAPRNATVAAAGPVQLLALERAEFLDAVTGSHASSQAADRAVDRRLAEASADVLAPPAASTQPQRNPSDPSEPPAR
jgi:MFS family permease